MAPQKRYLAIDLKSFYASVECVDRGLDPLGVNLVVADQNRTDKTICLAVSPSLKALGIPGRARLFEAKQRLRDVNAERRLRLPDRRLREKSVYAAALAVDPTLEADMLIAPPRMARYMEISRRIVEIYLQFVAAEDLLVYSVDEVFLDVGPYLKAYGMTAHELCRTIIRRVLRETGITATGGIGTNLYLAKIAMDIMAKHIPADADGVRIAELDERRYREQLWDHRPITDFWRVGRGTARRLAAHGMETMGDVARCSIGRADERLNEELLYRLFGVNAELLIDHAWGWEPAEIADCKAYVPENRSLSQGQVLAEAYSAEQGRLIVREMADQLSMELVRKGLLTDQVVLDVGYDVGNLAPGHRGPAYHGEVVTDFYGRQTPKPAHGSQNLERYTASAQAVLQAVTALYDRIVDRGLSVRRFTVAVTRLLTADQARAQAPPAQMDLFGDGAARERRRQAARAAEEKEGRMQQAMLWIRDRYGKNAVVRGMNMQPGATAMERNRQIGGHRAGDG